MEEQIMVLKIQGIEDWVRELKHNHNCNEKAIHQLRIASRELLSLLEKDSPLYQSIRSIIKKTNKIRDIDVFLSYFLPLIKRKNIQRNIIKQIQKSIVEQRYKKIKKFLIVINRLDFSLEKFSLSHSKEKIFQEEQKIVAIDALTLEQEALHDFRIAIKKRLYIYKNLHPHQMKTIKQLKKIKDELGYINDNYNGLALLKKYLDKSFALHKINKIIKKRNEEHFKRIKKLHKSL